MRRLPAIALCVLLGMFAAGSLAQEQPWHVAKRPVSEDVLREIRELSAKSADHLRSNDYPELIRVYQRLLVLYEQATGPDSKEVAIALTALASVYRALGRHDLVSPLEERATRIGRGHALTDASDYAHQVVLLIPRVIDQLDSEQFEQAERTSRQALALLERAPPDPGFTHVAAIISRLLADALVGQGHLGEAESLLAQAIARYPPIKGFDGEQRIQHLLPLLKIYRLQGRWDEAERLIASIEALLVILDRPANRLESGAARVHYLFREDYPKALAWSLREHRYLRLRSAFGTLDKRGMALDERRSNRSNFLSFLWLTHLGYSHVQASPELMDAAFEAGQMAQTSKVGDSIAQMAVRHAAPSDEFAQGLRRLQDLQLELVDSQRLQDEMIASPPRDATAPAVLEARITALRAELVADEGALKARFPKLHAMTSLEPVSADVARQLLHPGEALLAYTTDTYATYAWVVRDDGIRYATLPVDMATLEREIAAFRAKLVSGEAGWAPQPMTPVDGMLLYEVLFARLQPWLQGVERIILVADGPLQSLPFAALSDGQMPPDWLGKRYAFSVLPSVGALRALRGIAEPRQPELSFAGFGDPVLAPTGLPLGDLAMRSLYGTTTTTNRENRLVDPELLRGIASLPDTGVELKAVAQLLGAPADALRLGKHATETQVKRMPLDRYRILSFATHGVTAGELSEGIEPGLILTPPDTPTPLDDGYLGASEAAQLKLDADWVLLSACNTAASDGTPGAEGLSGLANAFIYAGARALLVSHWRVSSEATTKLVAETIAAYAKAPQEGKAAALQAAMQATMAKPEYAHPYFWAAFSVIGD